MLALKVITIALLISLATQQCRGGLQGCVECSHDACIECAITYGYVLSGIVCCDTHFQFPDNQGGCAQCQDVITGCSACEVNNKQTQCSECNTQQNYHLSHGICCNINQNQFPHPDGGCSACDAVIEGCQTCDVNENGNTICTSCKGEENYEVSGYTCCHVAQSEYPNGDGACQACGAVHEGCLFCAVISAETTVCTSCDEDENYKLAGGQCCNTDNNEFPDDNGQCESCNEVIQGCTDCVYNFLSSAVECTHCHTQNGYFRSGITCCDTYNLNFPNTDGGCEGCGQVIEGCLTCEVKLGQTGCTDCDIGEGYELSGSTCCNTNLDSYPDHIGGCTGCSDFITGCARCTHESQTTKCLQCSTGFLISGNTCCQYQADEFPTVDGGCGSCSEAIPGCLSCNVDAGTLYCSSCEAGYQTSGPICCDSSSGVFPDGQNGCIACGEAFHGCETCSYGSEQISCTGCDSAKKFQLSGGVCCDTNNNEFPDGADTGCLACNSMINGCMNCTYNFQNDAPQCTHCQTDNGYYRSGQVCCDSHAELYPEVSSQGCGQCENIIDGCQTCAVVDGQTSCLVCDVEGGYERSSSICCHVDSGLYPDNAGGCGACSSFISGCLVCAHEEQNTICTSCEVGLLLSGAICCNQSKGEFPYQEGGCGACSDVIVGCSTCDIDGNKAKCTECAEGYQISGTMCCDSYVGLFPDGFNGCESCADAIPGCQSCYYDSDQLRTSCTSCDAHNKYQLSGVLCCNTNNNEFPDINSGCSNCRSVISGCTDCTYDFDGSTTACTQCETENGYYRSGITCCDTISNLYPNGEGECENCGSIIAGCSSCTVNNGNTQCILCNRQDGYQISGVTCCNTNFGHYPDSVGGCSGCGEYIDGCLTCDHTEGNTFCTLCDTGKQYVLSNGICCLTTSDSFPNEGGCSSCEGVIEGCTSCAVEGGSVSCVECGEGFHISGSTCCDADAGLYPDGVSGCESCSAAFPGCLSCAYDGVGQENTCTQCDAASKYKLSGKVCCNTNANEFPDGSGCSNCHSVINGCSACTFDFGTSATACTHCQTDNGYYRSGSTCCDTHSDSFPDAADGCASCGQIITGCSTCTVTSGVTQCSSCNRGSGYQLSGTTCCNTNNNQYPDNEDGCQTCYSNIPGCLSCDHSEENTCTQCDNVGGFYLSTSTCCNINEGLYPNNDGCSSCNSVIPGCTTCRMNGDSVECTVCGEGFEISGTNCCDTTSGTFPNNADGCSSCPQIITGCQTCEYSSGAVECTICDTDNGYHRSGIVCCDTFNSFYPNGANTCELCEDIVIGCTACQINAGKTACTACDTGYQLSGQVCCDTTTNSFPDSDGGCSGCSENIEGCVICEQNGVDTECLSCDKVEGYQLSGTTCCNTNSGFYPDGISQCESCGDAQGGCSQCRMNGQNVECMACNQGFLRSGTVCCDVNSNSFPNEGGCSSCEGVIEGCTSCAVEGGSVSCVECGEGFHISGSTCCDADAGLYPDGVSGCESCSAAFPGCLSCAYDGVGQENTCTQCDAASKYKLSGKVCCNTNANEFPDGSGCSNCHSVINGCSACTFDFGTSATACTHCQTDNGYYRSGSTCCDTHSDSFPDAADGCASCGQIITGCSTCTVTSGVTQCSSCNRGSGYQLSGTTCCNTNNNQYPDNEGGCESCSENIPGCDECSYDNGQNKCSVCDEGLGYYLSGSTCCDTSSNLFPDENTCHSCDQVILGCTQCEIHEGTVECKSCETGNGFYLSGTLCCDTEAGVFPTEYGCQSCGNVLEGCEKCNYAANTGEITCQLCDLTNNYAISGDICCNTNRNQFPDGNNGCKKCSQIIDGCYSCEVVGGVTGCVSCNTINGYRISENMCCNINEGLFPDGNGGCESCSDNILGCFSCSFSNGVNSCTSCNEIGGFFLSGSSCCDSSVGLFADGSGCSSCDSLLSGCSSCKATKDAVECTECSTGFELSDSSCCDTSIGMFPDGQGSCQTCSALINGCESCHYSGGTLTCTLCDAANNYHRSGDICCDTQSGSFPDAANSCSSCGQLIIGCQSCEVSEGVTQCNSCGTGYQLSGKVCCDTGANSFPDSSGGCTGCSEVIIGCVICEQNEGNTECASCNRVEGFQLAGVSCCDTESGSYPVGNSCESCATAQPGCSSCRMNAAVVQCTGCTAGFLLSGASCCDTSAQSYPDGNGGCGTCAEAIEGCSSCQVNGENIECVACAADFELSGTMCCSSGTGFFPDGLGACESCSVAVPGCLSCAYDADQQETSCVECDVSSQYKLSAGTCCYTNEGQFPSVSGCSSCSSVIPGCSACAYDFDADQTTCTHCETQNGYYRSGHLCCDTYSDFFPDNSDSCQACSSLIPGCSTCDVSLGQTICSLCNYSSGYQLAGTVCCNTNIGDFPNANGGCENCFSNLPGCLSCSYLNGDTICNSCNKIGGYFLSGSSCCDTKAGNFPHPQGGCASCSELVQGCQTCQMNGENIECRVCMTGYENSGSICCDTSVGSYPDASSGCKLCSEIILGCETCESNGGEISCTICNTDNGYYRSGNTCCNGLNQEYPDGSNSCRRCDELIVGCQSCEVSEGVTQCNSCGTGYQLSGKVCCDTGANSFPDSSGGCTGCSEVIIGCVICEQNEGNTECASCNRVEGFQLAGVSCCDTESGSYPVGNSCESCATAQPGCSSCRMNAAVVQCTGCTAGFLLSGASCCDTSAQSYPDGNGGCGTCAEAIEGCSSCQVNGENIECVACAADFELSGTMCCSSGTGFFPDGLGACESCSVAVPGCLSCAYDADQQETSCVECDVSSNYELSGGLCCNTNVNSFPDNDGGCKSCGAIIEGCESCRVQADVTECEECETNKGYELSGTICCHISGGSFPDGQQGCETCAESIEGCLSCSFSNGVNSCTSCNEIGGFFLSGSSCCDSSVGLFADGSGCSSCDSLLSGCSSCKATKDAVECTECSTGFELSDSSCCDTSIGMFPDGQGSCQTCSALINGCESCHYSGGTLTCTLCDAANNYHRSGDICCDTQSGSFPDAANSCSSCGQLIIGCQSCEVSEGVTQCNSCGTGYQLSGKVCCDTGANSFPDSSGGCTGCSEVIIGCVICEQNEGNTECASCNRVEGFQLAGVSCCDTESGSYPVGNSCESCATAQPGCSSCRMNAAVVQCTGCTAGFLLSGASCCDTSAQSYPDGNGGCGTCAEAIEGCSSCQVNGENIECVACAADFELSGTMCCSSGTGFFPDGLGACESCSVAVPGCLSCAYDADQQETSCVECDVSSQYKLSAGTCCYTNEGQFPSVSGCSSCSSVIPGCSACAYDFDADQTTCTHCETQNGYYRSGHLCCDTYSDFFPDSSQSCKSCSSLIPGCQTCSVSFGITQCSQCNTSSGNELSGKICCNVLSGQFPDAEGSCESCSESILGCLSCQYKNNFNTCKACDKMGGFYLSGSVCCNINVGVYPDDNSECSSCSEILNGCESCRMNGDNVQCMACSSGFQLSGTICCDSSSAFYPSGMSECKLCQQIVQGCSACSYDAVNNTQCSSCDTQNGYYRSGSICCDSFQELFPDGSNSCRRCDELIVGCQSCEVSEGVTQCNSCGAGYQLSGKVCCDTGANSFPDSSGGCTGCSEVIIGCVICEQNEGNTECASCNRVEGFQLAGVSCCDTESGSYPVGNSCESCATAQPGCSSCRMNAAVVQCTGCTAGFLLSGASCCDTSAQSYPDGNGGCGTCAEAIEGCSSCQVNGENIECVACAADFELSGTMCCSSGTGFFPDGLGACESCSVAVPGCLSCAYDADQQETSCVECDVSSNYELSGGLCCNTNVNSFPDNDGGCKSCGAIIEGCESCRVQADVTECEECETNKGYELSGTICCHISGGSFPDGQQGCETCAESIEGCLSCSFSNGVNSCTSCNEIGGFFLSGSSCCDSSVGLFADGSGCSSCDSLLSGCSSCKATKDAVECTECSTGFELSDSSCCDTSIGMFPDGQGSCQTCSALINGCESCHYSGGTLTCTLCDAANNYHRSGDICCDTQSGSFPDAANSCSSCGQLIIGCQSCEVSEGVTQCNSCGTGYQLSGKVCCDTGANSFPDSSGGCTGCSEVIIGCVICEQNEGNTECASCNRVEGFQLAGVSCCDTESGSYPVGNSCESCATAQPGCSSCRMNAAVVQCTGCTAGFLLSGASCCDTSAQSYPDGNGGCGTCAEAIEGCSSCQVNGENIECVACAADFELSGTMCCSSGTGFFPDGLGACESCSVAVPGCLSCAYDADQQETSCVECDVSSQYKLSAGTCCYTNEGQFPSVSGCSSCSSVIPGCSACAYDFDADQTTCTHCETQNGYYRSGHLCCDTYSDFFPDNSDSCQACSSLIPGCSTCDVSLGQTVCKTCNNANGYLISKSICCDTKQNFFPDGNGDCKICSLSIPGCLVCSHYFELTLCSSCDTTSGYYLSGETCCDANSLSYPTQNGECGTCQQVIPGCTTCQMNGDEVECTACNEEQGYHISGTRCCNTNVDEFPNGNSGCEPCSSLLPSCPICEYEQQSLSCAECVQYLPHCLECSNSSHCLACDSGYFALDGVCTSCSASVDNCAECSESTCLSCESGHALLDGQNCVLCLADEAVNSVGNACIACSTVDANCISCESEHVCLQCAYGYSLVIPNSCINVFVTDNTETVDCSMIHPHCDYCTDEQTCKLCQVGYALIDSTTCQQCSSTQTVSNSKDTCVDCSTIHPLCLTCDSQTACSSCQDGFMVSLDLLSCVQCSWSQTLNSAQTQCIQCSTIDDNCVRCSDQQTCTGCKARYQVEVDGSGCFSCAGIDPSCTQCDLSTCLGCMEGYALVDGSCMGVAEGSNGVVDIDGEIYDCMAGCLQCTDGESCSRCGDGYGLINLKCQLCLFTCKSCEDSPTVCTDCYPGAYLSDGLCKTCPGNCLYCSSNECLECRDGYYLAGNTCQECSPFCEKCTSYQSCQACSIGYTTYNGHCLGCQVGCTGCLESNITICTSCDYGFYRNDEDKCSPCVPGCDRCSDGESCEVCSPGYLLNSNNECYVACTYPCLTCTQNQPTQCKSCYGGHSLNDDNECVYDDSCGQSQSCENCPRRTFLTEGQCLACQVDNCMFCSDDGQVCDQCLAAYYFNGVSCTACPQECVTCVSPFSCASCQSGYFLELDDQEFKTGRCRPCSALHFCKECRGIESQCTVCLDGYEFLGLKCVSEERVGFSLLLDMTLSSFLTKIDKFKDAMLGLLGDEYEGQRHMITLEEIVEGSVNVTGEISVFGNASAIATQLNELLSNRYALGYDFPISKSEIEIPEQPEQPEQPDLLVYGIVLAILMPLILILLIVFVLCTRTRRYQKLQKGDEKKDLAQPMKMQKDEKMLTNQSAMNVMNNESTTKIQQI